MSFIVDYFSKHVNTITVVTKNGVPVIGTEKEEDAFKFIERELENYKQFVIKSNGKAIFIYDKNKLLCNYIITNISII